MNTSPPKEHPPPKALAPLLAASVALSVAAGVPDTTTAVHVTRASFGLPARPVVPRADNVSGRQ